VIELTLPNISPLCTQEIGHFLAAFPKNVKLGIPFFIPNFTLGTFGAITQFKSILPDKKTMFDISMAGPVAGLNPSRWKCPRLLD